jgi:hypothetical protein
MTIGLCVKGTLRSTKLLLLIRNEMTLDEFFRARASHTATRKKTKPEQQK